MPSSRTPNKSRFLEAATIYRDAMVPFIDGVLGSDRIHEQLFNDEARKRNENKYDEGMRSLEQGTPVRNLIDHADIPYLIRDDLPRFSGLDSADVNRMHEIRLLWNRQIKHLNDFGDFAPEDAAEYATYCARVLRRCGLDADADAIIGTSSSEATEAPAASASDLREQRERREWDKARLAKKSPDELTQWEQERLADIAWQEEWERRELVRNEREEIARFGDDIDGLRSWFDADKARHDRHPSKHATLLQREQKRREQREREQRKREREERERKERERKAHERREQERKERVQRERERRERELRDREQAEIAAFGGDLNGLRRWFDTYKIRPKRHQDEYATLLLREHERAELEAREAAEQERREHELRDRERAEIAAFGDDLDGLRRWFDTHKIRPKRHPDEYVALQQREIVWSEQAEIAAFGDNLDGLRRWFDADANRRQRHSSERAALEQRERHAIAAFGENLDGLRRWFDVGSNRRQQHSPDYAALEQRERHVIAAFGDDFDGLRRWFDENPERAECHPGEFHELVQAEGEIPKLAALEGDLPAQHAWFDADMGRQQRHISAHAELTRREREWRHVARMWLASAWAAKSRCRVVARQATDLFARSLAMKVSAVLAISFVLICVLVGVRYGWWFEFAAVTWSATLPGMVFAGRASYCFRTANDGAVEEKNGRGQALLKESLAILAISFVLIYILVGVWSGWWLELSFLVELGAATIPGLLLAGHVGYRFRTTNDAAVAAKIGRSPALLSTALFYLLIAAGVIALIPVAIVVWMFFSDD